MGGGGWFYVPKVRFEEYGCRSVGLRVFEVTLSTLFTFPGRGVLVSANVMNWKSFKILLL